MVARRCIIGVLAAVALAATTPLARQKVPPPSRAADT
jgi:hypothetical protein